MDIRKRISRLEANCGISSTMSDSARFGLTVWADDDHPGLYCTADGAPMTLEETQDLAGDAGLRIIHGAAIGELPAKYVRLEAGKGRTA